MEGGIETSQPSAFDNIGDAAVELVRQQKDLVIAKERFVPASTGFLQWGSLFRNPAT